MTRYEVTAATGYRGHKLGEEFDADLTEDEERRALERGSLKIASKPKKKEGEESG